MAIRSRKKMIAISLETLLYSIKSVQSARKIDKMHLNIHSSTRSYSANTMVIELGRFMNTRLQKNGTVLTRTRNSILMVAAGIASSLLIPSGQRFAQDSCRPRNWKKLWLHPGATKKASTDAPLAVNVLDSEYLVKAGRQHVERCAAADPGRNLGPLHNGATRAHPAWYGVLQQRQRVAGVVCTDGC